MSQASSTSLVESTPRLPLDVEAAPNAGKWLVLIAAFLGWMFDGLEMGIFPQIARSALGKLLAGAASVGIVIVGVIGAIIRVNENNWRSFAIIGAAPALLTFIIRIFVPESPRWQQAQIIAPSRPLRELWEDRRLTMAALLAIAFAS